MRKRITALAVSLLALSVFAADALAGQVAIVSGGAGNDTLSAATLPADNVTLTLDGGAGADTMAGGIGNDRYLVDNSGDVIIEAANAGMGRKGPTPQPPCLI